MEGMGQEASDFEVSGEESFQDFPSGLVKVIGKAQADVEETLSQYLALVHSASLPFLSNRKCRYSPPGGGDTVVPAPTPVAVPPP